MSETKSFKTNLGPNYKKHSLANAFDNSTGHFWALRGVVTHHGQDLADLELNLSYLAGRPAFREYLISNP